MPRAARRQIERAIAELPDVYRQVFVLAEVEGLPNADIAEATRLSLVRGQVEAPTHRLLMRDALAAYFEECAF